MQVKCIYCSIKKKVLSKGVDVKFQVHLVPKFWLLMSSEVLFSNFKYILCFITWTHTGNQIIKELFVTFQEIRNFSYDNVKVQVKIVPELWRQRHEKFHFTIERHLYKKNLPTILSVLVSTLTMGNECDNNYWQSYSLSAVNVRSSHQKVSWPNGCSSLF